MERKEFDLQRRPAVLPTAPVNGLSKSAKRRLAKKKRKAAFEEGRLLQRPVLVPKPKLPKCMVCRDKIDLEALYYDCANGKTHSQCLSCFSNYVISCCKDYWVGGKFPLRCPVPHCKKPIDDLALRHLLTAASEQVFDVSKSSQSLWSLYERAQLEAALNEWHLEGDDTVVRCMACNKYAEIFPKDYQSRASRIVSAMNAWKSERESSSCNAKQTDNALSSASGVEIKCCDEPEIPTEEQAAIPVCIERFVPDQEIGMTGHFFECKTAECGASVCLRCDVFLRKGEQLSHLCASDPVQDLYREVLSSLAKASTSACPKCKRSGQKDLNCCNISCVCGTMWCYHCGQRPSGVHFGYNFLTTSPLQKELCPSYLQNKYGDDIVAGTSYFNGDPQLALERFHIDLQMKAVAKLKSECKEPEVWQAMMDKHFPNGIWAASALEWFEKRAALIKERQDQSAISTEVVAPTPAPA